MPRAIDVHVHPPYQHPEATAAIWDATDRYFRAPIAKAVEEMAQRYEELDLFGVLFSVNMETARGDPGVSNDEIAAIVRRYPKQFIGFAGVDPWQGKKAVWEVERAVKELGLRGVKFQPAMQEFYPNERRFYPIYEKCAELGVPVIIHVGTTGFGAGLPGGGGIHLKYTRPIPYVDDVAADFPELTIIMAHPAWPWLEEELAVCLHKANCYIDLSGWSPRYFQPALIQYANTLLQDKVVFGTDYPYIDPERWLRDFAEAPFGDAVRPKILLENAKRILRLEL